MLIGPYSQGVSSLFTSASSANSSSLAQAAGNFVPPDQDSTDPKDVIAQIASGGSAGLLKYQEKQIAEKAKEDTLKSMGLSDADLKNLSPQQLSAVDQAVAKAIQAALKASMQGKAAENGTAAPGAAAGAGTATASGATGGTGFEATTAASGTDPAAAQNAPADGRSPAKPSGQSLLDGSTLTALFDFQGSLPTGAF